ncbi:hypothetical protein ACSBL2_11455 [Pedobacter sp. AW31-3R]|uniref:hypothetical protein n=1 Tax=Pedobacter sp. AW31-3R TaxID=3445781 RepID=UPI003FA04FC1
MFYLLISVSIIFFIIHVALLLTSFPQSQLARTRYFYSHLTLWITGIIVFVLALLYSGSGRSSFLDYFDSTTKKVIILGFTAALSLVAHSIVKFVVVPMLGKNHS